MPDPAATLAGRSRAAAADRGEAGGFNQNYIDDPDTIAQCRDFLDCIKSRKKPTSDIEIGFHSTLPCLLGAARDPRRPDRTTWDGKAAKVAGGK